MPSRHCLPQLQQTVEMARPKKSSRTQTDAAERSTGRGRAAPDDEMRPLDAAQRSAEQAPVVIASATTCSPYGFPYLP